MVACSQPKWRTPLVSALFVLGVGAGCLSHSCDHSALAQAAEPAAELTVIRPKAHEQALVSVGVTLDEETLVRLRMGRYARFRIRPGSYAFGTQDLPAGLIAPKLRNVALEAGRSYFLVIQPSGITWETSYEVEVEFSSGDVTSNTDVTGVTYWSLTFVNEEAAMAMIDGFKEVVAD